MIDRRGIIVRQPTGIGLPAIFEANAELQVPAFKRIQRSRPAGGIENANQVPVIDARKSYGFQGASHKCEKPSESCYEIAHDAAGWDFDAICYWLLHWAP